MVVDVRDSLVYVLDGLESSDCCEVDDENDLMLLTIRW